MSIIEILLEKGADLNSKDNKGWTPLSRASQNGHMSIFEMLLVKGAAFSSNVWEDHFDLEDISQEQKSELEASPTLSYAYYLTSDETYSHELVFKNGQIVGGSLRALIGNLTAHKSAPDAMFVSTFYLTFRLFATPLQFAEALAERFKYIGQSLDAAGPVRLLICNVFKTWLELHWHYDSDETALGFIVNFVTDELMADLPIDGRYLLDLADKKSATRSLVGSCLGLRTGETQANIPRYVRADTPLPGPVIVRKAFDLLKQRNSRKSLSTIYNFNPVEVARQLTIKGSRILCLILPEELLETKWSQKSGLLAVNVRAILTFSTDLACLVTDTILIVEEPKNRAAIIKFWVKVADKCLELRNYETLVSIVCSLKISAISRLKRTWDIVSQRTKTTLEHLRSIVDFSRDYAVLRQHQQNQVLPCLPFIGTYLMDLAFVDSSHKPTRTLPTVEGEITLINFDKHMKTTRIVSDLQRFQVPYHLTEIPELQTWLQNELVRVHSSSDCTSRMFHQRSLILEPN